MALEIIDILDADFDEIYLNGTKNGNIDAAFKKVKKNHTAFSIWRIENLSVVPVPKDQYGIFYDKDSYIIYAATQYGQPSGSQSLSRELRSRLEYHIHFWLGNATSADKAGIAAYKTVELDSYLGGSATQHREVQGRESPRFKSYFIDGIRVLSGGTDSGFNHVEDTFQPRLYRVKGIRAPIITQMPTISWAHFNSGDVFILHTKNIIFVWVGRAANSIEKLHATKTAIGLRAESNTPNMVFVDDGYEKTLFDSDRLEFEQYLPLDKRVVKSADEVEDDAAIEKKHRTNIKLYQCADNNGKYRVTEIKTGPLNINDLNSNNVFILDHGTHGIWVWVGKEASYKEKVEAIRNARGFVKKKKYAGNTPVTRVVDGAEPIEFKMIFAHWQNKHETKLIGNQIQVVKVTRFDAATMYDRPALAAKSQLIDDGSGSMQMWRIKRFDAIELPKDRFGVFYNGDCYVILYNYRTVGGARWVIYYWMGANSIPDEKDYAALKSAEIDNTITGTKAMHVRVVQDKEPAHFLQLFKGRMRIFNGKGTDCDVSGKNMKSPNSYLLHIQGSATYNTKAIQVPLKASSLNSNYCFVLRKSNTYFIWCGSYSTGDNREMAKGFVGVDFTLLLEGSESNEFWSALGGKHDYTNSKLIDNSIVFNMPARLFQCSTAFGFFKAEEILNFVQKDLAPEDVMLLDAQSAIYLWIGNLSTKEEQKLSLLTATEFLKTDPSGRDLKTPIIQLKQGQEPPTFTGFFDVWDDKFWKHHKSYEELRAEIERGSTHFIHRIANSENNIFDNYNKYSILVLRGSVEALPPSVDPLNKELHLTYDDFVSLFAMEYKEFEKLPMWKRQEMKKNAGLF